MIRPLATYYNLNLNLSPSLKPYLNPETAHDPYYDQLNVLTHKVLTQLAKNFF